MVQRKKQITIEEKEIDRMEKELIATVKRPAEAEAYKIQQLAEGQKSVSFHTRLHLVLSSSLDTRRIYNFPQGMHKSTAFS